MAGNVLKITDSNFKQEVVDSQTPTLVDFWAEWCGPCRMVAPILDELAPLYTGRLKIGKMNVDENSETPSRFGIMNIPTLILFRSGNEIDRIVGAMSKADFQRRLDQALAAS